MWFTETPWPPVLICTVVGVLCVLAWTARLQTRFLVGAVLALVVAILAIVIDATIETEKERVEAAVYELAATFRDESLKYHAGSEFPGNDQIQTFRFIATLGSDIRQLTWRALRLVEVQDSIRITDLDVTMKSHGSRATTHFRANATVTSSAYGGSGHQPTRWELTWQREWERWKIIRIRRLDVITGKEISDIFAWDN